MKLIGGERRKSASAPTKKLSVPKTARERILRALELGRRGRELQQRAKHGRAVGKPGAR